MRVVERKLYIQDSATQTFIQYLDAETLTSTIIIDNCADDFVFTDDQRIQISSGTALEESSDVFIILLGAETDVVL